MGKTLTKPIVFVVTLLLLVLPVLVACNGGDDDNEPTDAPTQTTAPATEPAEEITITIGVISDVTGMAAQAYVLIDLAVADIVRYYNEENIIPGIKLDVITYDGQFDPAKDIPGYEWLKERGADVIFSAVESTPIVLKPRVERDEIVMFTGSAQKEGLEPPGWIFATAQPQEESFYTFLKWIAENDWDYQTKGPAKIGLTNWNVPLDVMIAGAIERYTKEHPDQFEWVGSYFTDFSFTWGPEIEALKDCDYLVPPTVIMSNFARDYRHAGHTAKFIGYDAHLAYFGNVADANVWDQVDDALFYRGAKYWNEDGPIINLAKDLLHKYHPDQADSVIRDGIGYTALATAYQMLEIIANTIETVGAENFNSQALYETAERYSLSLDGLDDYANFSPTKRTSFNYIAIYEMDAEAEDIFRLEPGVWHRIVTEP
ncbi:MAG: ABC transporter substrate-binding protein [Chloroflexi bacterium]|nr:ABC transporter substrate-binding protein [Chloroflexota bacterium]